MVWGIPFAAQIVYDLFWIERQAQYGFLYGEVPRAIMKPGVFHPSAHARGGLTETGQIRAKLKKSRFVRELSGEDKITYAFLTSEVIDECMVPQISERGRQDVCATSNEDTVP